MKIRFDPLYGALFQDQRWFPSPAHLLRRAALLEECAHLPPGRLLDAGCGAGRLLIDWNRLGHTGWGVDIDAQSRQLAESCVAAFNAGFEIAPAPPSPKMERFDYLVVIEVLEHLQHLVAQLRHWLLHLKEGGVVIASVPAFSRLWGKSDEWAGHVQRFEPDEFVALMEKAGLRVLSTRLYGFPLANLTRVAGDISSMLKMRRRGRALDRASATEASGHDRTIESKLRRCLMAMPSRAVLRLGIWLQRWAFRQSRGIGVIVIARKDTIEGLPASAALDDTPGTT